MILDPPQVKEATELKEQADNHFLNNQHDRAYELYTLALNHLEHSPQAADDHADL